MTFWSDESIKSLTGLWKDGLSVRQIAVHLGGITRNAVIGKLYRLGFTGRSPSYMPRPKPKRANGFKAPVSGVVEVRPKPAPAEAQMPPSLPPGEFPFACNTYEIGPDMCRWPLGEPTHDMRYCGAPSWGSWCPVHRGVVFKQMVRRG